MNFIKTFNLKYSACVLFFALASCGGGGGSSSDPTSAGDNYSEVSQPAQAVETVIEAQPEVVETETYEPELVKLEQVAESSNDLYVAPDFNFEDHKSLTFDISATDDQGQNLSDSLIFVYQIDSDIEELEDERLTNRSMLVVLKTDSAGQVYQQLETPVSVTKLMLKINTLGIENTALVNVEEGRLVQYRFE